MFSQHKQQASRRWFPNSIGICLFAVLIATGGIFGAFPYSPDPAAYAQDSSGYTADQLEALDFLNEVRSKAGVPPLKLNTSITKAAESHASYYNLHKDQLPGLSAHSETEGTSGFTGKSVYERIKSAGYVFGKYGYSSGEVMHFNQPSSTAAVQGWLNTAYHRRIILSPLYRDVGIALVNGTAVLDTAGSGTSDPITGGISVYPYDQQTNVGVGFYGLETPNPLSQFNVKYSGYIISATTVEDLTDHKAVITDEQGNEVVFNEELYANNTLFLYPKTILKGNHTYTVKLSYQIENSSEQLSKVWSFTTGKGHSLISLHPLLPEITLNEGGQTNVQLQGQFDDGVTEAISSSAISYTSSNRKGLQISSDGILNAIQAGDYTVKAVAEGKTTSFKVKVYPKWKTTVYTNSSGIRPSDLDGHLLQSSLEWALRSGILTPSNDGKINPNASVSEAEFWTMLLKTYGVNIQTYQPAKVHHWSDAAYVIAKQRNYPLAGITNTASRNTPITRLQIAEIVAAADGLNVKGSQAVTYVLAKDYIQGVTELSYNGFDGSHEITRAEAAQLLEHLHGTLSELRGRPVSITPDEALPDMPQRVVYVKPTTFEDRSMFAEYREDRKLVVEGKFTEFAGQTFVFKVQEKGTVSKQIEDVQVTFDSQGFFHIEVGPYKPDALNLYLYTPSVIYYIPVKYNAMNYNQYS